MAHLLIPARYNGPASSGNGGWTSGALAVASGLAEPVTVQLRMPPPLERPLDLVPVEEGSHAAAIELRLGGDVVAVAESRGPAEWTDWADDLAARPVTVADARRCEARYPGLRRHPFPRCFTCGTAREDGLRIFPGRLDEDRVAASWTPNASVADADGRVTTPVAWAALDCVGGWSSDLEERPLVLAQICVRVQSPPQAGAAYAVVGTTRRVEGRKTWTASALVDSEGQLVAQAEHLWIEIDAATVSRLQS